jgi:hypothetical protein
VAAITLAIAAAIIILGACFSLFAGKRTAAVFAQQIMLGLEFLLAGGLIRLASAQGFRMLGVVAAIIVVRRTISIGIRFGVRAAD